MRQWQRAQAATKPQQPTKPDEPSTSEVKVLESSALAVGASRNVVVPSNAGDIDLVVTRSVRGLVAFSRKCTHFGYLVCHSAEQCGRDEGALPDQLVCGYHGSVFSASTGAVIQGPANRALKAYKVTERSGSIYITL
ncbi:MAG: Rieske (2Fe-2S) protein [Actinomycetota bacterium]